MKKILYIVATQYENMGDLLINKCLVDELAKYGKVYLDTKNVPQTFKSVLLEHPNSTELSEVSNISLKGKGLFLSLFSSRFKFDYVFKSPGPFGGSVTLNEKVRAFLFYIIFFIMKLKGAKSVLIGNDFILASKFDESIAKLYSGVLQGIYVRSKKNVNILKELGVSNVDYSPDMCFMMDVEIKDVERNRVGISFRDMGDGPNQKIKESVKRFVQYFTEKQIDIDYFYQVERDKDFNQQLFFEFKTPFTHFRENVLKWEDRSYYQDKIFLLSNRLHVLLLGQAFECIPIALEFNQLKTLKIRNIFYSIGMQEQIYDEISKEHLDILYDDIDKSRFKFRQVNHDQKVIFNRRLVSIFEK
ncbi:polysaccharide pyruvyl transferase family protein [Algoriphagus sp. AGSA1]|uniref:polysaccharide pyruvyl transferase family protein n=1 Tax=Algoriphagus sp. AGSA1 TaxID=2907213 RepID=UPI001F277B58|nr:polysaccharide pyruvyl transferase family protein [Algoriphagus sp. AGSA1]MCE7053705.1 polysaccharide pyruvyl transferase family protein [Algoriphagus sp. AGSA1]